jgi:NADH:ubiquinone oxidoreductase subunit K
MYLFTYVVPITGMIITGRLEVPGDFAETAHRIMGAELLYRFGLSCQFITSVCCIVLAMGLYMTVKPVNNSLALFAMLFRLAESTLGCAAGILSFVVLDLYLDAHSANAFNATQLSVLMDLFTGAPSIEFNVAMVLLGIGSILFFYLFLKSSYIPKVLSAWSLFASALFTLVSFAFLLFPQYSKILQFGWLPMGVAEISVGMWLLLKGVNLRTQGSGIRNSVAGFSL